MQSVIDTEIAIARDLFHDAIFQIEGEGRSVRAFASAALLAASEVYAEVHGSEELRNAFAQIAMAEMTSNESAGRA